jgi:hypothetical protein
VLHWSRRPIRDGENSAPPVYWCQSAAPDGAAGVAPRLADPALDGDRIFGGSAGATTLVWLTHRAAMPRTRWMVVRHSRSPGDSAHGEGFDVTVSPRGGLVSGVSLANSPGVLQRAVVLPCRAFDIAQHGWACAVTGTAEQEHAEPAVSLGHVGDADIIAGELSGAV